MTEQSVEGSPGAVGSTPDKQPAVRFYAGVTELEETLQRAEKLGAKTVTKPSQVAEDTGRDLRRSSRSLIRPLQGNVNTWINTPSLH